ncbi:MAG: hypothetical protein LLF76_05070 [Planctomycetaceae bacterium]|nr:hypothetical protein [Planctomycetaceae bacterium]
MEEKGSLGIYLAPDKAVAVWTSPGTDAALVHRLAVQPDAEQPAGIALQAARAAARAGFAFDEAFIAIDCGYFTQYNLNSEFDDYKQIETTIKFDVEEAAASDAVNLAVAFEITGKETVGAAVNVYTADRQRLTDILLDTQEGGLDPTLIEPDAVALVRALCQTSRFAEQTDALFIVLSEKNCYLLRPHAGFAPMVRTLLVQGVSNIEAMLTREILLARASQAQSPLADLILIGQTKSINTALLAQRTGLKVRTESPEKNLLGTLADDGRFAVHELLSAYGAALAARSRTGRVDFRRDFMPYQGQRKIMQASLRILSIAAAVLLLTIAIFFQAKAFRMKGYARKLSDKNIAQYKAVMHGNPPANAQPSTKLKSVVTQVKNLEAGIGLGDDSSIPAKLTFFFEAVNSTPANVDIVIQQVTVTSRSMKVKGDTNSRSGTMSLLNEIKKHPRIALGSERLVTDGARDVFEITINPKKTEARK